MATLEDLVEDMARLTDAPCTLEDPDFRLIAFSDHRADDVVDPIRQRSILQRRSDEQVRAWFREHGIETSPGPLRVEGDAQLGIVGRLCVPARHLDRVHGWFWLLDPDDRIPTETWPEATRIAEAAARLLGVAERRQTHRDALFRELVEGGRRAARASADELARAVGVRLDEPVACVLVERPDLLDQVASRPARAGVAWFRSPDVVEGVVRAGVLEGRDDLDAVLTALGVGRRVAELDGATRVAVGPTVEGIDDLAASHRGAQVALRVARAPGSGELVRWSDLGPLALLGLGRDDDLREAVLDAGLTRLLAAAPDDVLATVRTWLEEAGSASRTAERLSVHRQTVYHRLDHAARLGGLDLSRGADRLRLHLALELAPHLD